MSIQAASGYATSSSSLRASVSRLALGSILCLSMLVVGLAGLAPDAQAAQGYDAEIAETCGDLGVLGIPEGPFAIEAAESLRARGAPNPPGIEAALDTLVAAADFESADPPPLDEVDAALATINDYFGGVCDNLDRCAFVAQIRNGSDAEQAEAARLLRRIETPSPPGIDAALALIAGVIDESPFHDTVAEARDQVLGYYPCGGSQAGGDGGTDGGGDGTDVLAFTGASTLTAALAAAGAVAVAGGAGLVAAGRARRRTHD